MASRLEDAKISSQNEINSSPIRVAPETTTDVSTTSSTTEDNRPVKEATLYNFVVCNMYTCNSIFGHFKKKATLAHYFGI